MRGGEAEITRDPPQFNINREAAYPYKQWGSLHIIRDLFFYSFLNSKVVEVTRVTSKKRQQFAKKFTFLTDRKYTNFSFSFRSQQWARELVRFIRGRLILTVEWSDDTDTARRQQRPASLSATQLQFGQSPAGSVAYLNDRRLLWRTAQKRSTNKIFGIRRRPDSWMMWFKR